MSTITLGVDLAKSVFSVCEVDGSGHVLRRLDGVGLRLAEAANALADGAMKRSY